MKIKIIHIIFYVSWIIPLIYSCSHNESINVAETIRKYNLNYQTVPMGNTIDNSLHGDGSLFGSIHYNKTTYSCLYILRNYKNDTLLIHLDRGLGNYSNSVVIRQNDNYFFLLRNFGKTKYSALFPNIVSTPNISDSYKIDKIISFSKIDTIRGNMVQVKRTPDKEIISSIKKHFNIEGDFYMVHPPLESNSGFDYSKVNAIITIAKDTIDNYQSYYWVSATFESQKKGKDFELTPNFTEINHIGLLKDNTSFWEENIGNTRETTSIKYKYYYYYLDPVDSAYLDYKKLNKIEIISYSDNKENIITTLKEEDLFKYTIYKGQTSEFRPEMFRYYNGEYFITTFLPKQDEYIESFPPIYHLDTVEWKLNKLEFFDPLVDKKYSVLQRKVSVDITGNYRDTSLFLESFEIVKVNDEYRLIKKGI